MADILLRSVVTRVGCASVGIMLKPLGLVRTTSNLVQVRHLFTNEEKKKTRRKQLWNEAKQGYFNDFHELRKNGGKISEAPSHLLSRKETARFPKLSSKSLSGESVVIPDELGNRVSLVLLSLRAFGMKACDQYRSHFLTNFDNNPEVSVYDISVVDKLVYRMMGGFFYNNLKRQIDAQRHGLSLIFGQVKFVPGGTRTKYRCLCLLTPCLLIMSQFLYYSGKFIEERQLLGIHNSIVGYCFLLDKSGFVRWKAHASPTVTELKGLVKCTKLLIDS